jgi:hypothetical protein
MFTDEHVNYFTFEGLNNLMKSLHYSIINTNITFDLNTEIPSGCPCLSTLWEKTGLSPSYHRNINKLPIISSFHLLNEYIKVSEKLQKKINLLIDSITTNKLAVWGTGNTSSRLIANSGLKYKNIVRFYDSDIRKKDTLFFGKKIAIFNPDDIERGEIDTILIASYVFQEEIYSNIKKSGVNCTIIRLF